MMDLGLLTASCICSGVPTEERETLVRELERERMLRVDAEQRLREVSEENDSGKSRLQALQDDFRKMEEMVKSMIQCKGKLDTLKQEKTSLAINYENNMQKFRTHVSNLEHENKILMAEIKNIESQCSNCQVCNKELSYRMSSNLGQATTTTTITDPDGGGTPGGGGSGGGGGGSGSGSTVASGSGGGGSQDNKTKVLLERLKMLEAEKSSLVLENENQRQQYDKCLDEIAGQVVQALMSQKTLREECTKLQKRVQDLEIQNRQLSQMFQQKIKHASTSLLQSIANKKLSTTSSACVTSNLTLTTSSSGGSTTVAGLTAQTQVTFVNASVGQPSVLPSSGSSGNNMGTFSELSMGSLQSICSDYNEQLHLEDSLGKPQLSSPPPWLRDRVFQAGESPTSSIASPSTMMDNQSGGGSAQGSESHKTLGGLSSSSSEHSERSSGKRIPPSSHSLSPRVTTNESEQPLKQRSSVPDQKSPKVSSESSVSSQVRPSQSPQMSTTVKIETEFPAEKASPKVKHLSVETSKELPQSSSQGSVQKQMAISANRNSESCQREEPAIINKRNDILRALTALTDKSPSALSNDMRHIRNTDRSLTQEPLLIDPHKFSQKFLIRSPDGLHPVHSSGLLEDSDSEDEDEDSYSPRGVTRHELSGASTMSLNDILDQGLDDMETPNDEYGDDDPFILDNIGFSAAAADKKTGSGQTPNVKDMIQAGRAVLAKSPQTPGQSLDESQSKASAFTQYKGKSVSSTGSKEDLRSPGKLSCKPPLPRPLTRPSSLDLSTSESLGGKTEPKSCLEYSSDSDSDLENQCNDNSDNVFMDMTSPPNLLDITKYNSVLQSEDPEISMANKAPLRSPTKSENEAFNNQIKKLALEQTLGNMIDGSPNQRNPSDLAARLGVSRKDYGDYVLLKAPGQLAISSDPLRVNTATQSTRKVNADPVSGPSKQSRASSVPKQVFLDSPVSSQQGVPSMVTPTTCTSSGGAINTSDVMERFVSPENSVVAGAVVSQSPAVRQNVTSSPDSAMQQSFSSTSSGSDTVLGVGERPACFRDDGYSSTSGASFSITDSNANRSDILCGTPSSVSSQQNVKIGKLSGPLSPNSESPDKSSIWTREGICKDMKASLERRGSMSSSTTSSDGKISGLVSEMTAFFERKTDGPSTPKTVRQRRHSLPSQRDQEGDYVFLDSLWPLKPDPSVTRTTGSVTPSSSTVSEGTTSKPCSAVLTQKPTRPKMGIPAKTRSLIESKRRSSPSLMSTYPSDPCLLKASLSKSSENLSQTDEGGIKRTSSDSCLLPNNNFTHQHPLQPRTTVKTSKTPTPSDPKAPVSTATTSTKPAKNSQKDKKSKQSNPALKERSRSSSLSALRHNKVSMGTASKENSKNQCIVGYVTTEPPVPQLNYKIPTSIPKSCDIGVSLKEENPTLGIDFVREKKEVTDSILPKENKGMLELPLPKERVRVLGEGSEHGYKSGDDQGNVTKKRPEAIGSDRSAITTEHEDNKMLSIGAPAFDVRKYRQVLQGGSPWPQTGTLQSGAPLVHQHPTHPGGPTVGKRDTSPTSHLFSVHAKAFSQATPMSTSTSTNLPHRHLNTHAQNSGYAQPAPSTHLHPNSYRQFQGQPPPITQLPSNSHGHIQPQVHNHAINAIPNTNIHTHSYAPTQTQVYPGPHPHTVPHLQTTTSMRQPQSPPQAIRLPIHNVTNDTSKRGIVTEGAPRLVPSGIGKPPNISLWSSDNDRSNLVSSPPLTLSPTSPEMSNGARHVITAIDPTSPTNVGAIRQGTMSGTNYVISPEQHVPCVNPLNPGYRRSFSMPDDGMNPLDIVSHPSDLSQQKQQLGNFKDLMESLVKKSEGVLKSKIFHNENCISPEQDNSLVPQDLDALLTINFDDEQGSGQAKVVNQIPSVTPGQVHPKQQAEAISAQQMEALSQTMHDLQRKISLYGTEPSCLQSPPDDSPYRPPEMSVGVGSFSHFEQRESRSTMTTTQQAQWPTRNFRPPGPSVSYGDGFEASSSSCDEGVSEGMGDSFIKKFRRRKRKSKSRPQLS